MTDKNIIQELKELESSLAGLPVQAVYTVPVGYFESFSDTVLNRIKAMNAVDAGEELSYLSPLLNNISKELPYSVPQGYFSELSGTIMDGIRIHEDYQTPEEELELLSPLLNSIGKKMPYSIPQGYFENLAINVAPVKKEEAKVISLGSRNWFRYAAAAVVIGVITLGGILFFNTNKAVDPSNTHAWVEKNMNKVSTGDINTFIQLADEETAQKQTLATAGKTEIKELLKDVSDKDIQNFLNETAAAEDNSDDILLN